jgi:hypothetical protein
MTEEPTLLAAHPTGEQALVDPRSARPISVDSTSPNAPSKRDVLGTALLSVLSGHRRYAHITALRADTVNPPLLGMNRVLSEDAIRRAFERIEEEAGIDWLREQLDYTTRPLLGEPWILDADTTVKTPVWRAGRCCRQL